jgi:hypothetical protein
MTCNHEFTMILSGVRFPSYPQRFDFTYPVYPFSDGI